MTTKTPFTHADGRLFTPIGEAPHVTRDGREIVLNVWRAPCLRPHCPTPILAKTATPTPAEWRSFKPPMYCPAHRTTAKKLAAREGLRKWLDSPEGQASRASKLGPVENAVLRVLEALDMVQDGTSTSGVLQLIELPEPEPGKRDTRRYRVMRAIDSLVGKDLAHVRVGRLYAGPRPPRVPGASLV